MVLSDNIVTALYISASVLFHSVAWWSVWPGKRKTCCLVWHCRDGDRGYRDNF